MRSTMQDAPLLVSDIVRHGQHVYGDSLVITAEADGYRSATFTEVGARAEQLAKALTHLGVGNGDRVGTFCWNHQAHLEAYLAVPSMGAVLHTVNIRLFPDQLVYVTNHAEDRVLLVDASLAPLLARVRGDLKSVEHVVVVGGGGQDLNALGLGDSVFSYEALLAAEEPGYDWPVLDERDAAALCYTSGTTGMPKGVAYSHRSTFLHSMAVVSSTVLGMTEADRMLPVVPMFHANAWGTPYGCWLVGCSLVMPQQFLQGEPLLRMIAEQQVTLACGVPAIWNDLLRVAEGQAEDLRSLRGITAGGSAVPPSLIEAFERLGIPLVQGWGMTETSPLGALALPPAGVDVEEAMTYQATAGRVLPGVEMRVAAPDGSILPNDGESVGELEIRGPWVTGSYYLDESMDRFHDGWLRTGDIGSIDRRGYVRISDRTKDVIKSGGEWISSVEVENQIIANPDVFEATVIAIPDNRWGERPLAVVVPAEGRAPKADELVGALQGTMARWWLPQAWTFVDAIPKTSVGKFDKKALRAAYADGQLSVVNVDLPAEPAS